MNINTNSESGSSRLLVVGLMAALLVGGFTFATIKGLAATDSGYGYGYGYGSEGGNDNGGNGRSGGHRRSGGGSGEGQVLGASTTTDGTCGIYLENDVWYNRPDRPYTAADAMKIQTFLNEEVSANLPVTGFYGPMTRDAVNTFQLKYADEVLAPWVPYGLPNKQTPTGNVYKTTRHKINMIKCPTLNLPAPIIP